MKTSHLILATVIISVFILFNACEKAELEFSCNPTIDKYVRNNKKALSDISIDTLLTYDIGLQRAIFNSWDYRKKREVWLEKLYIILENENLSSPEKNHIIELINHISENYFSPEILAENQNDNSIFSQYWIEYARYDLGWPNKYIALIVYRLYTNQQQLIDEQSSINDLRKGVLTNNETSDCNCSSSSDYCDIGSCGSGNCNIVSGCGWLWSQQCDGSCY